MVFLIPSRDEKRESGPIGPDFVTVTEMEQMPGVSEATDLRWHTDHGLPLMRYEKGAVFTDRQSLAAWFRKFRLLNPALVQQEQKGGNTEPKRSDTPLAGERPPSGISVAECAAMLGVSEDAVYRWYAEYQLPLMRRGRGALFSQRELIVTWSHNFQLLHPGLLDQEQERHRGPTPATPEEPRS